jgi:hypothetical protein
MLLEKIEETTIKISNRLKQNANKDENTLPNTTTVRIDLQSNNENVL